MQNLTWMVSQYTVTFYNNSSLRRITFFHLWLLIYYPITLLPWTSWTTWTALHRKFSVSNRQQVINKLYDQATVVGLEIWDIDRNQNVQVVPSCWTLSLLRTEVRISSLQVRSHRRFIISFYKFTKILFSFYINLFRYFYSKLRNSSTVPTHANFKIFRDHLNQSQCNYLQSHDKSVTFVTNAYNQWHFVVFKFLQILRPRKYAKSDWI